jgi:ubiquinone/menaquinone biosynthesis C-methylase UbiE
MKSNRNNRFSVPKMEGAMARWYAKSRRSGDQLEQYRTQAAALTQGLPKQARILEVAPGPGYQTIEIARLGYAAEGLDISHSFVRLAAEAAREAGVDVPFQHGDVAKMPHADGVFSLIVCQAAFKNFTHPVTALNEMHRVLRPGAVAVIQDMARSATSADIAREVQRMRLKPLSAFMTRRALAGLRLRAASAETFQELAAQSAFGKAEIRTSGLMMEVRLTK